MVQIELWLPDQRLMLSGFEQPVAMHKKLRPVALGAYLQTLQEVMDQASERLHRDLNLVSLPH